MTRTELDQLSDAQLAARIVAGDGRALEFLMRRHNRVMFRAARAILRNDADAEETVQEAYLQAYRGLAGFRGEARLSTWLVRIAVNRALARRRATARDAAAAAEAAGAASDEDGIMDVAGGESPEEAMMRSDLRHVLEQSVDRLPRDYRAVFMLRAVEGMSVADTAACLGISPVLVKVRLFRARRLLRETLDRTLAPSYAGTFSFDGARCDRIVASVFSRLGLGIPPSRRP